MHGMHLLLQQFWHFAEFHRLLIRMDILNRLSVSDDILPLELNRAAIDSALILCLLLLLGVDALFAIPARIT